MATLRLRRVIHSLLVAAATLASLFAVFCLVSGHWQILTSNIGHANDTIPLREPIIRAIESFRERNGRYPRLVEEFSRELKPKLQCHLDSSPFPSSDWRYIYLSDHDYRLVTTTCHFISSFDAVVYQRSGNYPAEWSLGNLSYPVKAGYYLIGAQKRMPIGEPLVSSK